MLISVVAVGDCLGGVSLEDLAREGGLLLERRDVDSFWADPGLRPFDLAFVAYLDLPDEPAAAIRRIRSLSQRPEIAVLGIDLEARDTLELQAAGAYAVVPAGLGKEELTRALSKLVSRRREALVISVKADQGTKPIRVGDLVYESAATEALLRIAQRVAASDTSLLLLGETGSGKEWLARAIHAESRRAAGPFIAVNCGAIPESLLESELFGHEKGAFTGAIRNRRGYFEQAHGGTLFLDEIGEMPAALQVRLLRVLQDRIIQRLGSEESIEVDTRLIAATHRDLKAAMESGQFRPDLYYRLAVVTLTVPALRERLEDLPALAELYLNRSKGKLARPEIRGFTEAALKALKAYSWPGNVRELVNVVERAVLLCNGQEIDLADLPMEIAVPAGIEVLERQPKGPLTDLDAWLELPLETGRLAMVADFERRYLQHALERYHGNIGKTSQHAGVDPRTLYNKMRQLGLRKEDYKD